jgi:hypothetical protein
MSENMRYLDFWAFIYIKFSLFIHQLLGTSADSTDWLLWRELQYTWVFRCLCCMLVHTPLDKCPRKQVHATSNDRSHWLLLLNSDPTLPHYIMSIFQLNSSAPFSFHASTGCRSTVCLESQRQRFQVACPCRECRWAGLSQTHKWRQWDPASLLLLLPCTLGKGCYQFL